MNITILSQSGKHSLIIVMWWTYYRCCNVTQISYHHNVTNNVLSLECDEHSLIRIMRWTYDIYVNHITIWHMMNIQNLCSSRNHILLISPVAEMWWTYPHYHNIPVIVNIWKTISRRHNVINITLLLQCNTNIFIT